MKNQAITSSNLENPATTEFNATNSDVINQEDLVLVSGGGLSDILNKIGNDAQNGAGIGSVVGGGFGALAGGIPTGGIGAPAGAFVGANGGAVIGGALGALWGLGRGIKDEIFG
jgi:hypothetical protein